MRASTRARAWVRSEPNPFGRRRSCDSQASLCGRPNTRQFIVDGLKGGLLKLDTVDIADMTVRVIGSTGIVTSVQTLKGTYDDSDVSGKFRVTDVLVKHD